MPNFLLNKGGAGISISREETAQRLTPLLHHLTDLHTAYDSISASLPDTASQERFATLMRDTRTDIARVRETIYSASAEPVQRVASDLPADADQLADREQAFIKAIDEELGLDHQIRVLAVLNNLKTNSKARLDFLSALTGANRR